MDQIVIKREFSIRRTELTCPAHSLKMMSKAAASEADEVILDLEDSCGLSQKVEARKTLIEALNTLDFKGKIRAFRPNNLRTKFFYRDLIDVVEAAGKNIDVVVIPKVMGPEDVTFRLVGVKNRTSASAYAEHGDALFAEELSKKDGPGQQKIKEKVVEITRTLHIRRRP